MYDFMMFEYVVFVWGDFVVDGGFVDELCVGFGCVEYVCY